MNADTPSVKVHFLNYPDKKIDEIGARAMGEIRLAGIAAENTDAVLHGIGPPISAPCCFPAVRIALDRKRCILCHLLRCKLLYLHLHADSIPSAHLTLFAGISLLKAFPRLAFSVTVPKLGPRRCPLGKPIGRHISMDEKIAFALEFHQRFYANPPLEEESAVRFTSSIVMSSSTRVGSTKDLRFDIVFPGSAKASRKRFVGSFP